MRLHIVLALLTGLALAITFHAGKRPRFTFADVQQRAQQRALAPYVPLPNLLPPQLKKLTPAQEQGIFWNDTYRLWRKKGLPFQVDFYPLANDAPTAPVINTVDAHGAHLLAYSPTFFRVNIPIDPPLPLNLGYGGFYIRYPHMAPNSDPKSPMDGFFTAKGACYFRAMAKDQVYGLSSRGLAIDTLVENHEEFPQFVEWWLYQPAPGANAMVLDALLDSASVTGAYEFTLHPGAVTSVDVRATLFFRRAVPNLGIAPFSSMYFYGENARNHFGNYRPEIHDSDGVLLHTGKDAWRWRPLEQATFRQVYDFADTNPKGFGLLQRDRDFQHYQDLQMKYNLRPSAWVTPHGDWGKGAVQLIQLVTNNTDTDNVALLWHPDQAPKAGDRLDLAYTIDYYMNDANRPPLAYATQTLVNDPAPPPQPPPISPAALPPGAKPAPPPAPPAPVVSPNGTTPVQFLVDFAGDGIEEIAPEQKPDVDLTCSPGTVIRESGVEKNGYDKSWRVTFTIIPAKVNVPVELGCTLRRQGKPLSETWTYTWHPAAPAPTRK